MPSRQQLQELSYERLKALKILFEKELYDFVCHDSGYVIEFGLKSAVCRNIDLDYYPVSRKGYRTHSFDKLVELANIKEELENRKNESTQFFVSWSIVSKWSVDMRYEPIGKNKKENAEEFIDAIENEKDGVHPWIKIYW